MDNFSKIAQSKLSWYKIYSRSQAMINFHALAELVWTRLNSSFPYVVITYQLAAGLCISSADCEQGIVYKTS